MAFVWKTALAFIQMAFATLTLPDVNLFVLEVTKENIKRP